MTDFLTEIRAAACRFVAESPANVFPGSADRFFGEPLVGIAVADDPLWSDFKRIIGEHHLTPAEMVASFGAIGSWKPASVISLVLPIAEKTRKINRRETRFPSLEWVLTANRGNEFLAQLRVHLVELLRRLGYHAAAAQPVTERERVGELNVAVSSNWSERHVAYVAGLGTFGLNGGLITERGIAHRCGSVLTDLALPRTRRPYPDHRHYCLSLREGICGACIERCPCGAISREGNDKTKCHAHLYLKVPSVMEEKCGLSPADQKTGSCGLCQTGVPCECRIPAGM